MTAAGPVRPGEYVYLVPTLPTAPGAAYRMPLCEVVAVAGPRVTVALADGQRIETDDRNIKRERPDWSAREPRPRPRRPLTGCEELPLW